MTADLVHIGAAELGRQLAAGAATSREVVEELLARIERYDPHLGAFAEVYAADARLAADGLDTLQAAGYSLSPLHGVPIALKDLFEIEGKVATNGMPSRRGTVSTITAEVVRRLRAAGMIVLGKTHMVECAFGGWGTNSGFGTPRNPWDSARHRVPGGSSSGSAVAVAAGLAHGALGTDTGGSVRIPSSLCGLVGFKPTWGVVPTDGVLALSESLDSIGPMTRTVEDARLLLQILSGKPVPAATPPSRKLRLGILPMSERSGIDLDVGAAVETAVTALAARGAEIVEFRLGATLEALIDKVGVIIASEGFAWHRDHLDDVYDPYVRARLIVGRAYSAADYLAARREMAEARVHSAKALDEIDALLTPTTPIPADLLTEVDEARLPLSRFTRAVNYLGLCACSIPLGRTSLGLPIGLQLICPADADSRCLCLADWIMRETSHHRPSEVEQSLATLAAPPNNVLP